MIPDSRAHDGPVLNIDYDIIKNSARGLMDQAVASVTLWHITLYGNPPAIITYRSDQGPIGECYRCDSHPILMNLHFGSLCLQGKPESKVLKADWCRKPDD